jgi:DNA-binding NarL/FixJ family response regulator
MIRLYVIEDHESIIVSGLKRMFYSSRDGIDIVGSSKSVEDTINHAKPEDFDIFILDLWLESRTPLQDMRALKQAFPEKHVMIYTSETAVAWKIRMFEEGALAFITKTADRAEIKTAIQYVAEGRAFYPINIENINDRRVLIKIDGQEQILSPIQMEIINMLANGCSHQEIADVIGRSRSGLENILKGLRKKFNAKNNIELVAKVNKLS